MIPGSGAQYLPPDKQSAGALEVKFAREHERHDQR